MSDLLDALEVDLPDDLLTLALTHRSYAYEHGGLPTNERLEFLGDAVLGLAVTDELFHRHPQRPESDLAKMRAGVVNTQALAEVARSLTDQGLGAHLLLGRGELKSGGTDKSSILADSLESLLGAIYLHSGIEAARRVILRLFSELLDAGGPFGLEDQLAGVGCGPRPGRGVLSGDRHRAGPPAGVHCGRRRQGHPSTGPESVGPKKKPSRRPPRRRARR